MELNNTNIVALASAARITTVSSKLITNSSFRGCHVIIDATAETGTASVVPKIEGYDSVSGKYYTILEGNAITAVGKTVLKIYPGLTVSANVIANDILPNKFRVTMTHGNIDPLTYSVAVSLVK